MRERKIKREKSKEERETKEIVKEKTLKVKQKKRQEG